MLVLVQHCTVGKDADQGIVQGDGATTAARFDQPYYYDGRISFAELFVAQARAITEKPCCKIILR
jgi:hypothetical protein